MEEEKKERKKMKKDKNKLEEIKEIEENDNDEKVVVNNKNSNNSKTIYFVVIGFLLVIVTICITIIVLNFFKPNSSVSNSKEESEKVELKYTDKLTVKSEGVYITDVSEVVDEVMPSIVSITNKTIISSGRFGPSYTTEGAGSGVIVAENDNEIFILTNNHVVENSKELSIKFINEKSYDATVKGISSRKDIAIVSVSKKDVDNETLKQIKIATIGDSNDLKVGNGIIAIGNALGYGQSVTTGVVSALNREVSTDEYTQDMIQIDAAINGGNSGGALLNSKGEVVGINSVKYSSNVLSSSASVEGMGFAIPISDVKDIIEKLIKGENDEGGVVLGIEGYMTTSGGISSYRLPEGFYVSAITSGGNADKSELEIGNIITEVDGNTVTSVETFRKVLNKKEKGDTIKLKVKYVSRNEYKEKEITVTLN